MAETVVTTRTTSIEPPEITPFPEFNPITDLPAEGFTRHISPEEFKNYVQEVYRGYLEGIVEELYLNGVLATAALVATADDVDAWLIQAEEKEAAIAVVEEKMEEQLGER